MGEVIATPLFAPQARRASLPTCLAVVMANVPILVVASAAKAGPVMVVILLPALTCAPATAVASMLPLPASATMGGADCPATDKAASTLAAAVASAARTSLALAARAGTLSQAAPTAPALRTATAATTKVIALTESVRAIPAMQARPVASRRAPLLLMVLCAVAMVSVALLVFANVNLVSVEMTV